MKCLSIRQPWAWAILHAGKNVENRDWATKFRGPFLIHASSRFDAHGLQWLLDRGIRPPDNLPYGGIIGSAILTDCVSSYASKWFFGRFGFLISDARPCKFFACKGTTFFFNAPEGFDETVLL